MYFRKGDIIGVHGKGLFSWGIMWAEKSFKEKASRISHVGVITEEGDWDIALITEALYHVVERPVTAYEGKQIIIWRPILIDSGKDIIAKKAKSYIGRDYGYAKIAAHFLDSLCNGIYLFRRLCKMDKYPICSWVVAHSYSAVGMSFGIADNAAQPDDIDDYCLNHPAFFSRIYELPKTTKNKLCIKF